MLETYKILLSHYGQQNWWPADSKFEMMVGAILTQNTTWTAVERALKNLRRAEAFNLNVINEMTLDQLGLLLKPVGFFNLKAKRLKNYCSWYKSNGCYSELRKKSAISLRAALLSINGVGPETADDILLYAFNKRVFVIDAYTKRLFLRLGLSDNKKHYNEWQDFIEKRIDQEILGENLEISECELTALYAEYHALIVNHAKRSCKKKPCCSQCCLRFRCVRKI